MSVQVVSLHCCCHLPGERKLHSLYKNALRQLVWWKFIAVPNWFSLLSVTVMFPESLSVKLMYLFYISDTRITLFWSCNPVVDGRLWSPVQPQLETSSHLLSYHAFADCCQGFWSGKKNLVRQQCNAKTILVYIRRDGHIEHCVVMNLLPVCSGK